MELKCANYIKKYKLDLWMKSELFHHLKLRHYKKGEYLMRAGSPLCEIIFIVSGKAKTLYVTHNGANTLHSFLHPFTIIGDVEFFHNHLIINDVIAMKEMDCLVLSTRYRKAILEDNAMITMLAQQLSLKLIRSNHNKSVSLTYPVENRLAAYLCANAIEHNFQENLQDGANMIGCSYRQLQRILHLFIEKKLIKKTGKGKYLLLEEEKLKILGSDIYVL